MENKIRKVLCLLLLVISTACTENSIPPRNKLYPRGSYISIYAQDIRKLECAATASNSKLEIQVSSWSGGDACIEYSSYVYGGSPKYPIIARANNDITYYEKYRLWDDGSDKTTALLHPITNFNIVSSAAWNSAYPAGSSLNALFDIKYVSYLDYINSGYEPEYERGYECDDKGNIVAFKNAIVKGVDELTDADLSLICINFMEAWYHLTTSTLPDSVAGRTVTISFDFNGEPYSCTAEIK